MKKCKRRKEDIAEDFCFICEDGGFPIICDHKRACRDYDVPEPSFGWKIRGI
uniref:Uncharacterized protein n=1 Tax=Nelumbo nucifera TaxID=4432 RepID=A0A822YC91_NELNU|nr:TPA_asm: hypothetical protein HUJ06_028616 [Nelumbo nucifera]